MYAIQFMPDKMFIRRIFLKIRFLVLSVLVLFAVCSCTTITQIPEITEEAIAAEKHIQAQLTEARYRNGTQRIADAAWPLITKNLEICNDYTDYQIGIWFARKIVDDIGTESHIWGVADGSPAANAGLQPMDRVVRIDETGIQTSQNARATLRLALNEFLDGRVKPLKLTVRRNKEELIFSVRPVATCRSEIVLSGSMRFNAYATGGRISVLTGLLNFLDREPDLQYILAHELAHNVKGHVWKARTRGVFGGLLDGLTLLSGIWTDGLFSRVGLRMFSKAFENEADYVSMYILANAGVELDGIEDVWRRVSAEAGLKKSATHPSRPVRYLRMAKTRKEIEAKTQQGLPLIPNLRGKN